jgi:hypothetical protein
MIGRISRRSINSRNREASPRRDCWLEGQRHDLAGGLVNTRCEDIVYGDFQGKARNLDSASTGPEHCALETVGNLIAKGFEHVDHWREIRARSTLQKATGKNRAAA